MSPDQVVEFLTSGAAVAFLWWEVRQLRTELTSDLHDIRNRVARLEECACTEPPSGGFRHPQGAHA